MLCAIAALVTALMVPLVRRMAVATHGVTPVRQRDIHTVPTPRLGGLAMFVGIAVGLAAASRVPFLRPVFTDSDAPWGVLAAAGFICLLGALDDWFDLSWMTKLAGQVLAAGFLAWQGVQLITLPVGGVTIVSSRLSLIVTILVVVATINAINFVDGLDGLAAGVVAIGCGAFFLYSYLLSRGSGAPNYATLAALILALTVGACLGFLPHNLNPARIFMGDSGSMLLGLLFAAATISVTGQIDPGAATVTQRQAFGAFLPIMLPFAVLALPLLDMLLAVARRMRAGQSPFQADRMHLHHRLLQLGHTQRRAVAIMYVWTAVLAFGTAGLAVFRARQVAAFLVVGVVVALALTLAPGRWPRRRRRPAVDPANAGDAVDAVDAGAEDGVPSGPSPGLARAGPVTSAPTDSPLEEEPNEPADG
jgi:UDP-GlcNAc:undecaprenyl-phosphate GlcNAc-1-phosphate transferase